MPLVRPRGPPAGVDLGGKGTPRSSVGNIVGGLVYGGRSWRPAMPTQFVLAQTGEAVAAAGLWVGALTLVWLHPSMLALVLLLGGFAGAPIMIISSALLDTVAQRGALTVSYTGLVAAVLLGIAAGSYGAGALVEHAGAPSVRRARSWLVTDRNGRQLAKILQGDG